MGLLKFIAIVILVYVGIRFIGRFLLPLFLGILIKRASDNSNAGRYWQNRNSQEGEVKLKGKKTESRFSKDEGEYVDYEEIKD